MTISATASARPESTRLSVPVVLVATVFVATVVHLVLALRVPAPWIAPDELRYSELAKSLGDGHLPAIRGHVTFDFGLGYPLLLAPIWALFDDVTVAYTAAKVLNAVLMGLTAVPAYLLARRFVESSSALVVAALSVCIPSLLFAGTLMTEVALYPAFVLALFTITLALERPTTATQLAALGAVALAVSVKMLALPLLVGYVAAIPLFHWLDTRRGGRLRDRLRAYRTTWIVLTLMGLLGVVGAVVLGRSPALVLGAYEPFLRNVGLLELPRWMLYHVAAFDLFIAIIPFAASALVVGCAFRRDADRSARLFAVMCLTVGVPLFAAVAAYSSSASTPLFGYAPGAGANERATFVLAPLAFVGLMMWLRGRPGSRRAVIAVAIVASLLPATIPLDRFEQNVVSVQAFSLIPWVEAGNTTRPGAMLAASLAVGAAFALLALARARDIAFIAPVAAALVAVTLVAQTFMELTSVWSRSVGLGTLATWVDHVARNETVSVLWYETPGKPWITPAPRHRIVWVNEFFNRSIGDVYEIGSPMPYAADLPSTHVVLLDGRVDLEDGTAAPLGSLVLAPCYVRVAGQVVARDTATGASVYRVDGPVRATVTRPRECTA